MTSITAFLLVLTMTGVPVASIVCVTERHDEPATSDHGHGDVATSGGPGMSAGDSCMEAAISNSPFVVEHRAVPGAAVLATTVSPTPPELVRADALAVLERPRT